MYWHYLWLRLLRLVGILLLKSGLIMLRRGSVLLLLRVGLLVCRRRLHWLGLRMWNAPG